MKDRVRIAGFAVLFATVFLTATTAAQTVPGPNIVLFLVDDQGWTGTSVQMHDEIPNSRSDYYRTPALEKLAAAGMRFSNAYAPHPNCSPTRMSIQTGKSPARLGSTDILDVVPGTPTFIRRFHDLYYVNKPLKVHYPITDIPDDETTIAEFVKAHAPQYATGHFGKWHLKGGGPGRHGYDEHDGPTTNREGTHGPPNPKRIDGITERSLEFIEKRAAAGQPFLLQISHYAVHLPIRANPATVEAYEAREGSVHTNAGYGAMTEDLDQSLGAVMAKLKESGISDSTFVFYTSDNGGEVYQDPTNNIPLKKGKTHVWEGGIRVPLIVSGPGIEGGSASHLPVSGYDFFATFAELLGIAAPLPVGQDGGSLVSILRSRGSGSVERDFGDFVWYYPHYRNMKGVFPQAAIRSGDYKLVKFYEEGDVHLYDLSKDLGEQNDLAGSMSERAQELHGKLNDYLSSVDAKIPTRNAAYDPAEDLGLRPPGQFRQGRSAGN